MQELIKKGVIGPSLVISYSHSDEDVQRTVEAFDYALGVYRNAIQNGVENYLIGPPTQTIYREFNEPAFQNFPHD